VPAAGPRVTTMLITTAAAASSAATAAPADRRIRARRRPSFLAALAVGLAVSAAFADLAVLAVGLVITG